MNNFYSQQSQADFPIIEAEQQINPILPDVTRGEVGASLIGGADITGELDLLPVQQNSLSPDNMFDGHIQESIASGVSIPLTTLSSEVADPLLGNSAVVNSEALASLGRPGHGVKSQYYGNSDWTARVLTRIEPVINRDWGAGSPSEAIARDGFSASWIAKLLPEVTETYTFGAISDGGVRLSFAGETVFENWDASGAKDISGTIVLEAGQLHDLTFEYTHGRGDAAVELWWSSPSQPKEIVPTSVLYTPETTLPLERELHPLRFFTNTFYNPEQPVQFRGKVFAGDREPSSIDFWLQQDRGEWVDIADGTEFVPDSSDPGYEFFNYQLSDLEPGRYQLRGTVIDSAGFPGSGFTQSFTVLDLPEGTSLPDTVLHALARSVNLENYSAAELAETQRWIVNLRVGESSAELAADFAARNIGVTGHIPNSNIWEFSEGADPTDVASLLNDSKKVQFAYPQVPVNLELLSGPPVIPDDPLFDFQWHLQNTGQTSEGKVGVDANAIEAWDRATGEGITIAILDDGLQYWHSDLQGNYRADLSRDFNEGDLDTRNYDRDPAPFSPGLIFEAKLETPVQIDEEIPTLEVPVDANVLVKNLKLRLNINEPLSSEIPVYLESPNGTKLKLVRESNSESYIIDGEFPTDEYASGEWKLLEAQKGTSGELRDWSLILDVLYPHGTAVAGVAAAVGNNNRGIIGVAPDAEIAGLKAIAGSNLQDFQIADALYDDISEESENIELNQEIEIYNNSWKPRALRSGGISLMALHQGVTEGREDLGNVYVFGAGNNWGIQENVNYNAFANSRYTIAVGAINHQGIKARYSQQGAPLLISAPSGSDKDAAHASGITTTDLVGPEGRNVRAWGEFGDNYPDLDYTNDFGGTSAATPVVSGVVALMLEENPSLTWRDVQHILVETANRDNIKPSWTTRWSGEDSDEIRHSNQFGFGVVDADAAVSAAASWTPVTEEVSFSTGPLTVARPIPNGDWQGVTQTIEISENINIEWMEVVVDFSHSDSSVSESEISLTSRSDLAIELISPDGTKSSLANPWREWSVEDASLDNWMLTSVRHWGESSSGEWQFRAIDTRANEKTGIWNSWELKFYGTQPTTVDISATDADASEDGDSGAFTFTRTGGNLDRDLTVFYSPEGTATDADYQALTGTVVIPAGESEAIVPVLPSDDPLVEGSETVVAKLVPDVSYAIGFLNSATVTIADNDVANNAPTLTRIEPLTGAQEETSFTISYADLMEKFDAFDADGDPISFEIFTIASGTLMKDSVAIEPGVTTWSEGETVVWTPDTVGDDVTAFTVRAFDGTDYSAEVSVNVEVAALPIVTISASDANASENGDTGEFTLTRSGDTTSSLSVNFSIAGDAVAGTDYEAINNIIIPAGSSAVKIPITPLDDEEIEGWETVTVNLETDAGYKLGPERSAEVIIADNDFQIDLKSETIFLAGGSPLSAGDNFPLRFFVTNNERGEAGPFNVAFYLSEDDTITSDDRLLGNYEISQLGGNANTGLLITNLTLSDPGDAFWTGDGNYTIGLWIDSDNAIAESNEDNNANTGLFKDYLTFNIADTQPVVTIQATDSEASEDGDEAQVVVTRTGNTDNPLTVNSSTGGNASAGSDYSIVDNIIIPAGSSSVPVNIVPVDDPEMEGDETATINLVAGPGYKLGGDRSVEVSIADNDFGPRNVVTNTNDSGVGSLRDAIEWANDNPGRDTILFDIPGDGPHTISPESVLPDITEAVVIDGWSQNGDTPPATPLIELSGSSAGGAGDSSGLTISGSNVEVRGLVINNWQGHGIEIVDKNATDNWIYGNFIGTNTEGTVAIGNAINGVMVRGDNNIIGTNGDGIADASEANLISGNVFSGIIIVSNSNTVAGNRIGTNKDGTGAIANSENGVFIGNGASNNIIGTNGDGIADASEANLISGNVSSGIMIASNSNTVAGNRIGTNKDGTGAIANSDGGVSISNGSNNIIGTNGDGIADAVEGNLISGNDLAGISIHQAGSNVVAGNRIGTNIDGTTALGNRLFGVFVNESTNNIIGTNRDGIADAAEANLISGNQASGISIFKVNADDESTGNRIQGNSIFANAVIGINLADLSRNDRVTSNDIGDGDTGSNNLQNFPELASAISDTATTTIQGTLNSTANNTFTIEFFSNSVLDKSGYGEGETLLGFQEVTTDENGNASFTANFSTQVPIGHFITATATDKNGNTSEFSQGVEVKEQWIDTPWTYAVDPDYDSLGGDGNDTINVGGTIYEIYGMAMKEDADSIWVALNAKLPITGRETGPLFHGHSISNGNIGWGDLLLDFSGMGDFKAANDASSLFAVRFADTNDSLVASTGVYSNVNAVSVVPDNAGWSNLWNHSNFVFGRKGKLAQTGELAWNDPYYSAFNSAQGSWSRPESQIPNVISSGTKIGDIEMLTGLQLAEAGFDLSNLPAAGDQTFGFKFDKSLLPGGDYIASLFLECNNDAIAMRGTVINV